MIISYGSTQLDVLQIIENVDYFIKRHITTKNIKTVTNIKCLNMKCDFVIGHTGSCHVSTP